MSLTKQQEEFLENYFELLDSHFPTNRQRLVEAAARVGVTGRKGIDKLIRGTSKEIIERSYEWAALHLPQAVEGLVEILNDPTKPGAKNLIAAATTIMDRGGLAKTEKLNIETESSNAVLILPAKNTPTT